MNDKPRLIDANKIPFKEYAGYDEGMVFEHEIEAMPTIDAVPVTERIKELIAADEEGRCVILPCNVGDTIYVVDKKSIIERRVLSEMSYQFNEWHLVCANGDDFRDYSYPFRVIGKTVFLTLQEAEAALKMDGKDGETECMK